MSMKHLPVAYLVSIGGSGDVLRAFHLAQGLLRPDRDRGLAPQRPAGISKARARRRRCRRQNTEGRRCFGRNVCDEFGGGVARQAPLDGSVWHSVSVTGTLAAPVSALTMICARHQG
jgi:hypothetical protein